MLVIGCDFHPGWQQVCWVDTITGETEEKKLVHGSGPSVSIGSFPGRR